MYYRNANCAVVVYDITQPASLEKARTWIRELQKQADPSIIIALCGNKLDLSERRQVSEEDVKKCEELENLMWKETSAKDGTNVNEVFKELGTSVLRLYMKLVIHDSTPSREAGGKRAPSSSPWRAWSQCSFHEIRG